jgi:hypothetical protein
MATNPAFAFKPTIYRLEDDLLSFPKGDLVSRLGRSVKTDTPKAGLGSEQLNYMNQIHEAGQNWEKMAETGVRGGDDVLSGKVAPITATKQEWKKGLMIALFSGFLAVGLYVYVFDKKLFFNFSE